MPITFKELQNAIARPNSKEKNKQISNQLGGRGLFHDFLEEIATPELHLKNCLFND
jgi:hypothetical protein